MRFPPRVWTMDDLARSNRGGWFYGFFRDVEGRLRFGELYPRWENGYCVCGPSPWWSPRAWWWAIKDVLTCG